MAYEVCSYFLYIIGSQLWSGLTNGGTSLINSLNLIVINFNLIVIVMFYIWLKCNIILLLYSKYMMMYFIIWP